MDSPFIRDPDHQFAHVIFYAQLWSIYIYIRLAPLVHSLTYLGNGRLMKITREGRKRRGKWKFCRSTLLATLPLLQLRQRKAYAFLYPVVCRPPQHTGQNCGLYQLAARRVHRSTFCSCNTRPDTDRRVPIPAMPCETGERSPRFVRLGDEERTDLEIEIFESDFPIVEYAYVLRNYKKSRFKEIYGSLNIIIHADYPRA